MDPPPCSLVELASIGLALIALILALLRLLSSRRALRLPFPSRF